LALIVFAAAIARLFLPQLSNAVSTDTLLAPSSQYILGTDELGRDVLVRVAYGASTSLLVGLLAVAVGFSAGSSLGAVAALGPRWLDEVIMRFLDMILSFPAIVLALLVSLVLGQGLVFVALLIGFVISPHLGRIVRARLAPELKLDYIAAERSTGASLYRILLVHVARNILPAIGAYALLLLADSMLFEAALSYVGVGIQPPTASWGNMILEGQRLLLAGGWWVSVFPGTTLFLTVMCLNLLGDRIIERVDPQLRRTLRWGSKTELASDAS
jgi:peptide/nickel transport system permease protein